MQLQVRNTHTHIKAMQVFCEKSGSLQKVAVQAAGLDTCLQGSCVFTAIVFDSAFCCGVATCRPCSNWLNKAQHIPLAKLFSQLWLCTGEGQNYRKCHVC